MKRIVLAEDDSDDQDMVREIVRDLAANVDLLVFDDGEKLIGGMKRLMKDELPNLIILDQNMPRLKGTETISHLKTMSGFENIPAVIYTTYHDLKFAEDCKRRNIQLFQKPDTYEAFSKMIEELLERYV